MAAFARAAIIHAPGGGDSSELEEARRNPELNFMLRWIVI